MNERIKELRQALGLTQQVFADKAGTSRANIAGYETKKSVPSDAVISLICEKFNVNENISKIDNEENYKNLLSAIDDLKIVN